MGDNEIIKAFEYCATHSVCDCCPCVENNIPCAANDPKIALDLINRQKAEIEMLKKQIVLEVDRAYDRGAKSGAKVAVKEFAEKLKEKQRKMLDYDEAGYSAPINVVEAETIDNLVKEMTEGENG